MTLRTGLLLAFLSCTGCGGGASSAGQGEPPAAQAGLLEVGEMYTMYIKEFKKPPRKKADFEKYSSGFSVGSLGVQRGDLLVIWNAVAPADKDQAATRVLAYEKKTPLEGGAVLMQDGSVKTMTASEFAAAPKAGS